MKRASRKGSSIEQLVKPLADRFVAAIEAQIVLRKRTLILEWLERDGAGRSKRAPFDRRRSETTTHRRANVNATVAVSAPLHSNQASPALTSPRFTSAAKSKISRRTITKVQAPTVDPRNAERTAELNRLRSILRPAHVEQSTVEPAAVAQIPQTIETPDRMKTLEEMVRNGMAFLSDLSPARCAAHIAAWAGRARAYQEDQTDGRTRIAARLLLGKLRSLARAMDAGFIEALDPSWSTSDWDQYVKAKEIAAAESGTPAPANRAGDRPSAADEYGDVWG